MRIALHILIVVCLATSGGWAVEPAATQPASTVAQAAQGVIRGRISAAHGWDFQKPDLTRAVIYLSNDSTLPIPANPLPRATMGQRDKMFTPSFLVVPIGTEVEFPNWDHISHNVFSRSKAAPAFDLDRYPYGFSKTRTFDKVGVIQLFCNIHQQMRAVIVVTPNAFFVRPDADGRFEMTGVPIGKHELVIWHERCEEQRQAIEVTTSQTPDLSITLDESRKAIIANDPPQRQGGYGVERGLGTKRERLDLPVVPDAHPAPTQDGANK
jgi:hypothetical protein